VLVPPLCVYFCCLYHAMVMKRLYVVSLLVALYIYITTCIYITRWRAWSTSKTSIMWFIWRWIKIVFIPIVSCILLSPWTQRGKVSSLYLWRTNFFEVSNVQLHKIWKYQVCIELFSLATTMKCRSVLVEDIKVEIDEPKLQHYIGIWPPHQQ
jgi:hypothetical protein